MVPNCAICLYNVPHDLISIEKRDIEDRVKKIGFSSTKSLEFCVSTVLIIIPFFSGQAEE